MRHQGSVKAFDEDDQENDQARSRQNVRHMLRGGPELKQRDARAQDCEEMEACQSGAAFLVYNENNTCDLVPVTPDNFYVPVHFARTEAGTFFWTTVPKPRLTSQWQLTATPSARPRSSSTPSCRTAGCKPKLQPVLYKIQCLP
ncbi:unnamed protein product [Spodoptera littoralis]|uniref:Uncharacterized protein n=1 Tax=Spodoptera littoralis TaxID=7109 RepID=A0A9P0I3R9_SPOLI|nr:unnamed protein product [Spodoptera littoralis]CAH1639242.1 unnamed protein product [Spodoptera littoralis]